MSFDTVDQLHSADTHALEYRAIIDSIWAIANDPHSSGADFYDEVTTILDRNGWKLYDHDMACQLADTYGLRRIGDIADRAPRFAARLEAAHTPAPYCRCSCGEYDDDDDTDDDCCGCPCHEGDRS